MKILYDVILERNEYRDWFYRLISSKLYTTSNITDKNIINEIMLSVICDDDKLDEDTINDITSIELVEVMVISEKYSRILDDSFYEMLVLFKEIVELLEDENLEENTTYQNLLAFNKRNELAFESDNLPGSSLTFDLYLICCLQKRKNELGKIHYINNLIDEFVRVISLNVIKRYDNMSDNTLKLSLQTIYEKIKETLLDLVLFVDIFQYNDKKLYDPIEETKTLYDLLATTKRKLKLAENMLQVDNDDIFLKEPKEENDDILSQLVRVDYKKEAKEFIESLDKYYDVSNTVKFSKKRLGAIALSLYISKYFNHNHSFTEFQKLVCQYFDKEEISYKPNKVFDEFNKIMNDFPYNDFKADKEQYKRFFP